MWLSRRSSSPIKPIPASMGSLGHLVLVGTHHKTGTVWLLNLFSAIAEEFGWKLHYGSQADLPLGTDIFFNDQSHFDLGNPEGPYRGIHLIRDPRDILISAAMYHRHSKESWLHQRRRKFWGLTYQEALNRLPDLDAQILFEMKHSTRATIRHLLAWDYQNPNFIEVKYEDLIQDRELILFRRIFQFLGFPESSLDRLCQISYAQSLFSGQVVNTGHIRSGRPSQWVDVFNYTLRRRFIDNFGDALIRLGYEPDNNWVP